MIPKRIHYCWFGGKTKPQSVLNNIETWKKHCPAYEIVEWNEDNFEVSQNRYCTEAYESKKWAFVSDVARLKALYNEGGIYMDTDVEVIKPLDELLNNEVFFGFEDSVYIGTNIIGAIKGNEFIHSLLKAYDVRYFINKDGSLDTTTNVTCTTKAAEAIGLILNGKKQIIKGVTFYPKEYFCPYNYINGRMIKSDQTFSIHWYEQTWIEPNKKIRLKVTRIFRKVFGKNIFNWLK